MPRDYYGHSQLWADLPPRGHLAISGYIFGCHQFRSQEGATGIYGMEARDAAKHAIMLRTIPSHQMRKLRFREVK